LSKNDLTLNVRILYFHCFKIENLNMYYVYMDESWDLWFNFENWNSKYFLVTFLILKEPKISDYVMKKVVKKLKQKNMVLSFWVFHAFKENKEIIADFLNYVEWKDIKIMTLILDKDKYIQSWKVSKDIHLLYNKMSSKLLNFWIDIWILKWESIKFYAARKETNKFLNMQFENYIKESLKWIYSVDVYLRYPKQEKWLQVVDGLSYSIYQKYQNSNLEFYDIIKDKIFIEEQFI